MPWNSLVIVHLNNPPAKPQCRQAMTALDLDNGRHMSRLFECARVSIVLDTLLHMERSHFSPHEQKLVDEAVELLSELEASIAMATSPSE